MADSVYWSPSLGLGVLDYKPGEIVFTPKVGGLVLRVSWKRSRTGPADQKSPPRRKADEEEWWNWLTFTSRAGEIFSFRRGGPPEEVMGK